MSILVKNNIHWVGQRDWEVRDFHGTEYKTLRGSSYNSYLIREGKNVLIDTVDHKFSREFVHRRAAARSRCDGRRRRSCRFVRASANPCSGRGRAC